MPSPAPDALIPAAIALGSNLGDRAAALRSAAAALARLPRTRLAALSSWHETAPVAAPGTPPENAGGLYLNAAALLETRLSASELLDALLAIEALHGRDRANEARWGPRRLDLDLLLFNGDVIDQPGLHVPHPRMHERAFVLEPLAEIAPDFVHPVLCRTVRDLRDALRPERLP